MRRTNPFKYDDEIWRELESIVARAKGDVEKFSAMRDRFEENAGRWKATITGWNGVADGADDRAIYDHIHRAASDLNEALAELRIPAILSGNDLIWKVSDDLPSLNGEHAEFVQFCAALNHIAVRAKKLTRPPRRKENYPRDRFIAHAMTTWHVELELPIGINEYSLVFKFIEQASHGVFEKIPSQATLLNIIRKWKPGVECDRRNRT
jgi:hypothetical protein